MAIVNVLLIILLEYYSMEIHFVEGSFCVVYMIMMNALTLGTVRLWCWWDSGDNYAWLSWLITNRIFLLWQKILPCWRGCKIFILHISGLWHSLESWGPWSVTSMLILFYQRHLVESWGPWSGTSLVFCVVDHWRCNIMAFSKKLLHFSTSSVITSSS